MCRTIDISDLVRIHEIQALEHPPTVGWFKGHEACIGYIFGRSRTVFEYHRVTTRAAPSTIARNTIGGVADLLEQSTAKVFVMDRHVQ